MVEDQLYCINILNVYDGTAFDIGKLGKSFKNLEEEIRNGFASSAATSEGSKTSISTTT